MTQTERIKGMEQRLDRASAAVMRLSAALDDYAEAQEDIRALEAYYGSDEWKQEAQRRGLDTEASTPIVIQNYLSDKSVEMFRLTHVFERAELEARNEIKWETYTKKIQIEARIFGDLCMNHILPVATRYQSTLIDNVHKIKDIFDAETAASLNKNNLQLIQQISDILLGIFIDLPEKSLVELFFIQCRFEIQTQIHGIQTIDQ